jgi:hypothetical protein
MDNSRLTHFESAHVLDTSCRRVISSTSTRTLSTAVLWPLFVAGLEGTDDQRKWIVHEIQRMAAAHETNSAPSALAQREFQIMTKKSENNSRLTHFESAHVLDTSCRRGYSPPGC